MTCPHCGNKAALLVKGPILYGEAVIVQQNGELSMGPIKVKSFTQLSPEKSSVEVVCNYCGVELKSVDDLSYTAVCDISGIRIPEGDIGDCEPEINIRGTHITLHIHPSIRDDVDVSIQSFFKVLNNVQSSSFNYTNI